MLQRAVKVIFFVLTLVYNVFLMRITCGMRRKLHIRLIVKYKRPLEIRFNTKQVLKGMISSLSSCKLSDLFQN